MLFMIIRFQCDHLATGRPAEPSRKRSYMRALCWPLFMAGWALNSGSSQASFGEWRSVHGAHA